METNKYTLQDYKYISSSIPSLIFISDDGAMGTPGILMIIAGDKCFSLNHLDIMKNKETKLWNNYVKAIKIARKKLFEQDSDEIYLGFGNSVILNSELSKEFERIQKEDPSLYRITVFRKLLEEKYNLVRY